MTNERIRWKQRFDAISVECDSLKRENASLRADAEASEIEKGALKAMLDSAEKRAERAKIEGAAGLAAFLLTDALAS